MENNFAPKIEIPEKQVEELRSRIEELDNKGLEDREQKEVIKSEIKEYIRDVQRTPSFAAPQSQRDETEEIERLSKGEQVGTLVSLAFEQGLEKAVSVARKLKDPAVLDEFHDTLCDHYYEFLKEKGILS
jgi:hypothetical protein